MSTAPNDLSDLHFAPAQLKDGAAIQQLAHRNGGNARLGGDFLRHWYFENPSCSYSVQLAWFKGQIEGYATTNNFHFRLGGKKTLVAMPQNVLTSQALRGKGVFQQLYTRTEQENVGNGVSAFLTFTNEMSTPIFLGKFGYVRGQCPDVLIYPCNPLAALTGYRFTRLRSVEEVRLPSTFQLDNSMVKDERHLRWRYSGYGDELHIVRVHRGHRVLGYLVFKKETKKGIPILLLMEVLAEDEESFIQTVNGAPAYAARKCFPLLVMFANQFAAPRGPHKRVRNRFNFLLKASRIEDTELLRRQSFNLFFGDLDIV